MSEPDGSPTLALQPATEQARQVREREITASDLLAACLEQVERYNDQINAVVTLNPEAEAEAVAVDRRLAAGKEAGRLAGLVVGIKDVTETAGLRTTYGSPAFADHVPERDALVVERLRAAGAVILGKTNTPEFAAGGNTWNDVFGATRNPWNLELSAGGSTGGGAAALATGMISLAQGTDLGGSLRIPASFCGVTGLRPAAGLIPTWPSAYLWDDLQVTGTMGRRAADVALSLRALRGPDPRSPICAPWRDAFDIDVLERRYAFCRDIAGIGIDPGVESVCRDAIDRLGGWGIEVDEIELDLSDGREAFLALRAYWFAAMLPEALDDPDRFGVNVAANLRAGREVSSSALGAAEACRRRFRERFLDLFETYAGLLTPCMAVPPFPVEQNFPGTIGGRAMDTYIDWVAPTFLLSLPGLPVVSVPAGLDASGLPVGLQIAAPPAGELQALALAGAIEVGQAIGTPPLLTEPG